MDKIAVLVPCYNEGKILKDTLSRLKAAAEDFPGQTELIVVDDGSADNTAELAKQAGATVVSYGQNRGKGFALRAGAAASGAVGRGRGKMVRSPAARRDAPSSTLATTSE